MLGVLLEAASNLVRRNADVRINIHGALGWPNADFKARFEQGLRDAGPLVQYRGPYDRVEMPRLLRQVDWVVVPSIWWENAPLVIQEARAAGRPIICSGIGGMAELVRDGVDGLHVEPGDVLGLADTLEHAAEDTALWQRLASTTCAPPDLEAVVSCHLDLFESLRDMAAA